MLNYSIVERDLHFIKPARTSRNVFTSRRVYAVQLSEVETRRSGWGECAPLSLLSTDDRPNYANELETVVKRFCESGELDAIPYLEYPSIRFGIETAMRDLQTEGEHILWNTEFSKGNQRIPINGLVWMDDCDSMYNEALEKIGKGFNVIKFKVGAQDFDQECRMLEKIRKAFSAFKVTLRLDANGAFAPDEALAQLKELSRFEIHSIEQPIAKGNWDRMAQLAREGALPIALDEELIGIDVYRDANSLLKTINPQFIILKPNLIGGFMAADEWVRQTRNLGIDWWATSALEGNIGLNAIAQWVSQYPVALHQGLGTGSLFENNFDTRLVLNQGNMHFSVNKTA